MLTCIERYGGGGRSGMRGRNFQHICLYLTWQLSYWKLMDKVILSVHSSPIVYLLENSLGAIASCTKHFSYAPNKFL